MFDVPLNAIWILRGHGEAGTSKINQIGFFDPFQYTSLFSTSVQLRKFK
jgi:hypothetical protein